MNARCVRRWVSSVAMVAVVFGQLAVAAHACAVQGAAATTTPGTVSGVAHSGPPCADMDAAPAHAQDNACESHCSEGLVAGAQPDVPPAVLTALLASAIAVPELRAGDGRRAVALVPVSRAPPLTLQFCRLLI